MNALKQLHAVGEVCHGFLAAHFQDGGTFEVARTQIAEGSAGFFQWVHGCLCPDGYLRGQLHKFNSVLSSQVGNGNHLAFTPQ